ncbi:peptide-methionine (R)-S-oxide reductase MsrB [Aliiroseovarius sp. PTFE2010]|uniref:peptide-methionine (R)-S-oxide reductase MsrB n=1 Tax=Aliiroseovarius sp. PTFE2010 TaxID=3417190 RepID=UPI003CF3559C
MPKIEKSDAEWLDQLGEAAFQVTRKAATERAFSHSGFPTQPGHYECVCCGAELFTQGEKFESGCGWPSFYQTADGAPVGEDRDTSHAMVRTEVHCEDCGAHLGHVFPDGPPPTGLRYCINGVALRFVPDTPA